jgi:hypothetical protein
MLYIDFEIQIGMTEMREIQLNLRNNPKVLLCDIVNFNISIYCRKIYKYKKYNYYQYV